MRVALYARVSTTRQAQAQGIEQQLDRLRAAAGERGWELDDRHVYRDDGYSGARIGRPGLDRLRDHAALAELDLVLVTAPDRLARNYVHQVLLIEELAGHGCQVEFLDRPMSADPHDQLLLQIRGAVAEYENYAELLSGVGDQVSAVFPAQLVADASVKEAATRRPREAHHEGRVYVR